MHPIQDRRNRTRHSRAGEREDGGRCCRNDNIKCDATAFNAWGQMRQQRRDERKEKVSKTDRWGRLTLKRVVKTKGRS